MCYVLPLKSVKTGWVLLLTLTLIAGGLAGCGDPEDAHQRPVVRISASASIAPAIEAMSPTIEGTLKVNIQVNAGGSGVLAQQIMRGDRADLFISADTAWMDNLEQEGLIDASTRIDLAGNRLVLIGLKGMKQPPAEINLLISKQYHPIAVGDPAYVPAGRYAMQVLESHALGPGNGLRLAEAPNVRAAVAYVLAGQCPVGLVYASDVRTLDRIQVLYEVNPKDHDPICYPAAVMIDAPSHEQAQRVLDWLQSEQAQEKLEASGFLRPDMMTDSHQAP